MAAAWGELASPVAGFHPGDLCCHPGDLSPFLSRRTSPGSSGVFVAFAARFLPASSPPRPKRRLGDRFAETAHHQQSGDHRDRWSGGARICRASGAPTRAGTVLINAEAIGVNFIDTYFRTGLYAHRLPFTPGSEVCGVAAAVGERVSRTDVGDRVATSVLTPNNVCAGEFGGQSSRRDRPNCLSRWKPSAALQKPEP